MVILPERERECDLSTKHAELHSRWVYPHFDGRIAPVLLVKYRHGGEIHSFRRLLQPLNQLGDPENRRFWDLILMVKSLYNRKRS